MIWLRPVLVATAAATLIVCFAVGIEASRAGGTPDHVTSDGRYFLNEHGTMTVTNRGTWDVLSAHRGVAVALFPLGMAALFAIFLLDFEPVRKLIDARPRWALLALGFVVMLAAVGRLIDFMFAGVVFLFGSAVARSVVRRRHRRI